jgi:hypothetical protein
MPQGSAQLHQSGRLRCVLEEERNGAWRQRQLQHLVERCDGLRTAARSGAQYEQDDRSRSPPQTEAHDGSG